MFASLSTWYGWTWVGWPAVVSIGTLALALVTAIMVGYTRSSVKSAKASVDALRMGWLNPVGASMDELRRRTLTNLYNQRPSWLAHAHERLDRAVHAAYGWEYPLEPGDVLARLVELNLARSQQAATVAG